MYRAPMGWVQTPHISWAKQWQCGSIHVQMNVLQVWKTYGIQEVAYLIEHSCKLTFGWQDVQSSWEKSSSFWPISSQEYTCALCSLSTVSMVSEHRSSMACVQVEATLSMEQMIWWVCTSLNGPKLLHISGSANLANDLHPLHACIQIHVNGLTVFMCFWEGVFRIGRSVFT